MQIYKVSFEPHSTPRYVYEVEASNEKEAIDLGYNDFRFDIGYDKAKDFQLADVKEVTDD